MVFGMIPVMPLCTQTCTYSDASVNEIANCIHLLLHGAWGQEAIDTGSLLCLHLNVKWLGNGDLQGDFSSLKGTVRQLCVPGFVWDPGRVLRVDVPQRFPLDGAGLKAAANTQLQHAISPLHFALHIL